MFGFGILTAKLLGTILARIWLFAGVNSNMVDEMVLLPEAHSTSLALERPLVQVRLVMF